MRRLTPKPITDYIPVGRPFQMKDQPHEVQCMVKVRPDAKPFRAAWAVDSPSGVIALERIVASSAPPAKLLTCPDCNIILPRTGVCVQH